MFINNTLFLCFVHCCRTTYTAAIAMEHGQKTAVAPVT